MNESQADMIREDTDLADACADWSSALLEKIAEPPWLDLLSGIWRYLYHQVAQFEHDLLHLMWNGGKNFLNCAGWKHGFLPDEIELLLPVFGFDIRFELLPALVKVEKHWSDQNCQQDKYGQYLLPADRNDGSAGYQAKTRQNGDKVI